MHITWSSGQMFISESTRNYMHVSYHPSMPEKMCVNIILPPKDFRVIRYLCFDGISSQFCGVLGRTYKMHFTWPHRVLDDSVKSSIFLIWLKCPMTHSSVHFLQPLGESDDSVKSSIHLIWLTCPMTHWKMHVTSPQRNFDGTVNPHIHFRPPQPNFKFWIKLVHRDHSTTCTCIILKHKLVCEYDAISKRGRSWN